MSHNNFFHFFSLTASVKHPKKKLDAYLDMRSKVIVMMTFCRPPVARLIFSCLDTNNTTKFIIWSYVIHKHIQSYAPFRLNFPLFSTCHIYISVMIPSCYFCFCFSFFNLSSLNLLHSHDHPPSSKLFIPFFDSSHFLTTYT